MSHQGPDLSSNTVVNCQDENCIDCRDDYRACKKCDTTLLYYLKGTVCQNKANITGSYGVNAPVGTIEPCASGFCNKCIDDYTNCTECNVAASYYLHNGVCKNQAMLGSNEGINAANGTISLCAIASCFDCKVDYTVCVSMTPPTPPATPPTTPVCGSPGCLSCVPNPGICQQCDRQ